jgi:hypothetical protein
MTHGCTHPPGRAWALACLVLAASSAQAIDWPSVPVPAAARGERVSDHMVYNGLDMRASRFTVAASMDEVVAFYRAQWPETMAVTPLGNGRMVLGHLIDRRFYVTVDLSQQPQSVRAQVGILQMPDASARPKALGQGFDKLPGTRVDQDVVYMDLPARVRTLGMSNRYSPFQNDQFYQRRLASQGYTRDTAARACAASSSRCVSRYDAKGRRVTVITSRSKGETAVVAVIE